MVRLTERILPAIYARNGIADVGRKWLVERTDRLHRDWVVETENEAGKRVCCLYNPGFGRHLQEGNKYTSIVTTPL